MVSSYIATKLGNATYYSLSLHSAYDTTRYKIDSTLDVNGAETEH